MEIIINTMETNMVNNTIIYFINKMTNSHINTKEPLNLETVNMPGRNNYLFLLKKYLNIFHLFSVYLNLFLILINYF
jgi:hypothetical protein